MLTPPPEQNPYRPEGQKSRNYVVGRARHAARSGEPVYIDVANDGLVSDAAPARDIARDRLEVADEVDHNGLTLDDLQQLVRHKVRKARRDGDDAAYTRERAERPKFQAQAFDEGWTTGYMAGVEELRGAYLREFDGLVHGLHMRAVKLTDVEPKQVTKAELIEFAQEVAKASDRLIDVHGRGVKTERQRQSEPTELPF